MRVTIQAENLLLDEELEAALHPRGEGLRSAWQAVRAVGPHEPGRAGRTGLRSA